MEDEQALAGKKMGNTTSVEVETKTSHTYFNVALRVSEYRACVLYTLNIISIVEMLWYGGLRDLLYF